MEKKLVILTALLSLFAVGNSLATGPGDVKMMTDETVDQILEELAFRRQQAVRLRQQNPQQNLNFDYVEFDRQPLDYNYDGGDEDFDEIFG